MALSRSSKWFLGVCAVVVVALGVGLAVLGDRFTEEPVEPGQPVALEVEPGMSLQAVGDVLAEEGVVGRSGPFVRAASDADLQQQLRAGGFDLETGMGPDAVVDALLEGPDEPWARRVTIPEGLAVELILERLGEAFEDLDQGDFRAVLDERTEAGEGAEGALTLPEWAPEPAEAGDEIVEPYEGLLFPETYEFAPDASAQQAVQELVDQTAAEVDAALEEAGSQAREESDPYQLLIKASLVERETRVAEERPRVAGVIENRLATDMRLAIDATVLYARGEHTERVLHEDTEIDSPYNTYQVQGLPPAPIAAPGRAAIEAVLAPEEHDYRYYVLAPACDGSHRFAEDEQGHQENVAAFQDAGRCQ